MVISLENNYKLLQLANIFIGEYGYNQVVINNYSMYSNIESWFFNPNNKYYQLIRVTLNDTSKVSFEKERINDYLDFFKKQVKDFKFLDIHIGNEKYDINNEEYDHIIIDNNYYEGIDLKNIYPSIYGAVKNVDDKTKEITRLISSMQKAVRNRINRNKPIATYIIMGICIFIYLLSLLLGTKYDKSSVYVLLGADYMTFTLGLKQLYRLFTCAFVHNGFFHLFSNMYSLFFVGRYIEENYGIKKFLLVLFVSIIVGSLTQSILSNNSLCLGMSSGIYGLFAILCLDLLIDKKVPFNRFIPMIIINISYLFITSIAWLGHLGGFISGYLFYKIYKTKDKPLIVLLIVMILILFIKYLSIKTISPFYIGTDNDIINIYDKLGFHNYAKSLANRLINIYTKYGGQ